MKKTLILLILSVVLSTVAAVFITTHLIGLQSYFNKQNSAENIRNISFEPQKYPDFTYAAENSVNGVVFVKVIKRQQVKEISLLEQFFGYSSPYSRQRESVNSGSGVIVTPDGYIATNNHVVANGQDIEVTLNNNKTFKAALVGADPVTDVALLKIQAQDLPVIPFGNSDSLRLGEWVLAIGSPFNLRSTITAGIVSAKGRSLPDNSGEFKIESFIQTDAAVNPGNSGGALVNTRGELVGINTAIASNTGSYTGYSFAVPSAIVQKVIDDIKMHGSVRRALLGISMAELTQQLAQLSGMKGDFNGVYVADVINGGAAQLAGIRPGDIIVGINEKQMKTPSDIQSAINSFNPGDEVVIKVYRDGGYVNFNVLLKDRI